ncbi:MAG: methyltransferase domain-containing protein [Alphaproteobacteria bacterium]|nr:MAG: methyltransferase domain-containing protein [Alphaproteobacteria bacterium]
MHTDILDLMHFYNSPLGHIARRAIRHHIREIWPNLHGQRLVGLGYAAPFLKIFSDEAERMAAIMPATQGITAWPEDGRNIAALSDETNLPFQDYSIDRILMVHALEGCSDPNHLLQEAWRVLTGSGRLLLVVPNRLGLWARFEHTPFGNGQPYSASQLTWALRQELFTPTQVVRALYTPPTQSRFLLSSSRAFEKVGRAIFPQFSGLLLIEAKKEVYSAHPMRYRRVKSTAPIFPAPPAPVTPPPV